MPNDSVSPDDPVTSVDGIGEKRGETLTNAGFETVSDLQRADLRDLLRMLPDHVASQIKDSVGNVEENVPTATQARKRARQTPGAKAKVVKNADGKQVPKVLEKVHEERTPGATMTVHKG